MKILPIVVYILLSLLSLISVAIAERKKDLFAATGWAGSAIWTAILAGKHLGVL